MALPADQLDLLQQAASALAGWQTAAQGLPEPVSLQQVVMEFPPADQINLVQFTWDPAAGQYNIAMLNGNSLA